MKPMILYLALSILPAVVQGQVGWQSTNGPYYANIDDYAIGESSGLVVLYAADSAYVGETEDAFVLKSTDRGETWSHVDVKVDGVPVTGTVKCVATFRSNPNIVYAGVWGEGIYKSTDGGTSWVVTYVPENKSITRITIHPTNSSIVWAGCQKQIGGEAVLYNSANAGNNWTINEIGEPNESALSVSDIALSPDANNVWVSTHSGVNNNGIWRTLDGGLNWTPENDGITNNLNLASLAIDPENPDLLYCGNKLLAGTTSRIYMTTDGAGACEWSDQLAPVTGALDVGDLRVSPDGVVYATVSGVGVLKDAGSEEEWITLADDLLFNDFKAIEIDPLDESIVYAGTSESHYKSSDAGATWHERNQGALPLMTADVGISDGRLMAIVS